MFKNIKITVKITAIILVVSFFAILAISLFTYDYNLQTNKEKFTVNLNALADSRAEHISTYFEGVIMGINVIQKSEIVKTGGTTSTVPSEPDPLAIVSDPLSDPFAAVDPANQSVSNPLQDYLIQQKEIFGFDQILITNQNGAIIATTDPTNVANFKDPDGSTFRYAQRGLYIGSVFKDNADNFITYVAAPLSTNAGNQLLFVKLNLTKVYQILTDYKGLGATGEIQLIRPDTTVITVNESDKTRKDTVLRQFIYISPVRGDKKAELNPVADSTNALNGVLLKTLEQGSITATANDYQNNDVLITARRIKYCNWILTAKINIEEASGAPGNLIKTFLYVGVGILALAILLSMTFARSLTQPLYTMRNKLGMVAEGMLPERTDTYGKDEFGQMNARVEDLIETLKNNAEFAKRIGEGKYDTKFQPASENDVLGMSLTIMRKNLIENERLDKERNWIVRGVAEISEILRSHDGIEDLGDDVIKFILGKIDAVQGAFYVINTEEQPPVIELRATYAYGRKKYLQRKFKFAEGLVGQAVAEQDAILRTEIPDNYVTITSGILGDKRPTCLLIVPLITNEEVYGVLEFAGFKKFDSSQVKFVQELSVILARTIFNIKVNERTRKLLQESQEMSTELKEKQEVLRQNAEEMQATQEELKRTNQALEDQIEEVNRTQKRMQLLLENASEVITIYEEDESIRYISPSVETILGYGQKEMIGKSDLNKVHADHQEIFKGLFRKMIDRPDEKVTVQYEYKIKDGHYIWIESTGTNCMSNPAIHGYILNSRDITEKRRAEMEQRMRSKMQALSENSPDLITRLEHESISYINPVIEVYSGQSPASFLNRKVKEVSLDTIVLDKWLKIVEEVNATNEKVATEMDFPSEMGKRVMQVNAIPEYDESNQIESVLVVSHDITERKLIELEVQNKNKKITESINYAKRIQNSILPNTKVINRALPDSFILYKPRDVVSGDFPWYIQIKDEIFIAAVDCTGHGVPGALLSLIGYFLLNDIVRSRKITEPGKILDLLDEGVTSTLRQDEDSTTKDGMDIALCKINLNSAEIEYSGAHRPLYIVKNNTLEEIKGNKFPIGGGIFKNQTNFTNHKVKLCKGDSVYFCSDGFPDQFGGPEGRKFGPKRVREIIESVYKLPMREAISVFDHEWENWRGSQKQTDDVLLIGIKF